MFLFLKEFVGSLKLSSLAFRRRLFLRCLVPQLVTLRRVKLKEVNLAFLRLVRGGIRSDAHVGKEKVFDAIRRGIGGGIASDVSIA